MKQFKSRDEYLQALNEVCEKIRNGELKSKKSTKKTTKKKASK